MASFGKKRSAAGGSVRRWSSNVWTQPDQEQKSPAYGVRLLHRHTLTSRVNWYGLGGVFSIHSDIVAAPQRPDGEMYATASRLIFFPYRTEDAGDQDVFFASRNKDRIRAFCSQ